MAWNTITDVNDGQPFGGTNYQEVQDAVTQIQDALGSDENALGEILIERKTSMTGTQTFTVPAGFSALRLQGYAYHDNGSNTDSWRNIAVQINGDTSGNYWYIMKHFFGDGTESVTTDSAFVAAWVAQVGDLPGAFTTRILGVGAPRTVLLSDGSGARNLSPNSTSWQRSVGTAWWGGGATITSVRIGALSGGDDWAPGAYFELYGSRG